jgi:hypothetical protein
MDIFYCNNLLFPLPLQGFLWLFVFFGFCFCGVHLFKLARLGAENFRKKEPPPSKDEQPKEKEKAPASQEPIYYIVERKTRRAKSSYKEPKQIRFK